MNLLETITIKPLVVNATQTSTVTSDAIEITGYPDAVFYIDYGDSGDTLSETVYWTGKIQECATEGGTYTDVADADVSGPSTNAFGLINAPTEDSKIFAIRYIGDLGFVRVVVTATGTHSNGTPIAIFCALGLPREVTTDQDYNP